MKKTLLISALALALTLSLAACGTPRPVPANQGEAQTAADSAGGFGVRFARMLDTLTLLEG